MNKDKNLIIFAQHKEHSGTNEQQCEHGCYVKAIPSGNGTVNFRLEF